MSGFLSNIEISYEQKSLIKGLDRRNSVNSKSCRLPVGLSPDFSPHPVKYQGVREMNIYGAAEGLAMVHNFFHTQ